MNRIEYMRRLAALLQDVPAEERVATMQYYNDYFDDAGEENEEKVMEELGSPEQVAAEMKAGLGRSTKDSGEFRETGYTDPQFERKEVPTNYREVKEAHAGNSYSDGAYAGGTGANKGRNTFAGRQNGGAYAGNTGGNTYQYGPKNDQQYAYTNENRNPEQKPWTSSGLKLVLIILILLIVVPIVFPLVIALVCCVFAFGIAAFAIFIALAAVAASLAVSGIVVFVKGFLMTVASPAAAMMVMGAGMLLTVIGTIATVAAVRLCMIVLPGLVRFVAEICRKPFQKRKTV